MPIEIKELVIRAIVTDGTDDASEHKYPGGAGDKVLVETCVREVLRILRKSKER